MLPLWCKLKQNFLFDFERLIKYSDSAVNVVWSYPCVGFLPIIIYIFSCYQYAMISYIISTPKLTTFLPQLKFEIEESERESNPIP